LAVMERLKVSLFRVWVRQSLVAETLVEKVQVQLFTLNDRLGLRGCTIIVSATGVT